MASPAMKSAAMNADASAALPAPRPRPDKQPGHVAIFALLALLAAGFGKTVWNFLAETGTATIGNTSDSPSTGSSISFAAAAADAQAALAPYAGAPPSDDPRRVLAGYVRTRAWDDQIVPALAAVAGDISSGIRNNAASTRPSEEAADRLRRDMRLASAAMRLMDRDTHSEIFDADTKRNLARFRQRIDDAVPPAATSDRIVVATVLLCLGAAIGGTLLLASRGGRAESNRLDAARP